jgi:hypothetical protein
MQEFPDIVQQAGQVGFVRPVIAGCGGEASRQLGNQQRVAPERREIDRPRRLPFVEKTLHRQAGGNRTYQTRTKGHQATLDTLQLLAAADRRRVGCRQNAGAQTGILLDQPGELGHRRAVIIDQLQQPQQNLRRRGYSPRLHGLSDGLRQAMHRASGVRCRQQRCRPGNRAACAVFPMHIPADGDSRARRSFRLPRCLGAARAR